MVLTLQPIPYQGSKRNLAPTIFKYVPQGFDTLYEPFAGSAAVSLFAVINGYAKKVVINDSYPPLIELWKLIAKNPEQVASEYAVLWEAQLQDPTTYYMQVRQEYNKDGNPIKLLYLLSRCAKNAVRFNGKGEFNQSPDKRRLGRNPKLMRQQLLTTSLALKEKAIYTAEDYEISLKRATSRDLVYMDPPYFGTSMGKNPRYHQNLKVTEFIAALESLNDRDISYLLSFDGKLGEVEYHNPIPPGLNLKKIEIVAGRSAQATLNGQNLITVESLYISPALQKKLELSQ